MKTTRLFQALGSLLLFSSSAIALAQTDTTTTTLNASDSSFMQHAAGASMAEVQMGKLAVDKSTNADVKQTAQRIVDDHTKADDQLKTLAASKHVSLPTDPPTDTQKEVTRLQKLDGSAFDTAWSKDMVKDHQQAIKLFTKESSSAKDKDVGQFASSTLPTLKTHLQMAQHLVAVPAARDKAMDKATAMDASSMHQSPASAATAAISHATPMAAPAALPTAAGSKH